ncbi:MAG: tRNA (adenosine(37)-N6)-dimethylallyltransferase MiaA [Patescibacteria group bacterium]
MPKILVILGPTASGKSELAVKIARKFNGEIISADSRQVYKGLNIGSGKVPKDKVPSVRCKVSGVYYYKGIPHHLLDVASPKRTFTVSQYQKLAKKALADIIKRNKLPIICGGTGLYIDALIYDYQLPAVPPQPKLRKQLEKKTTEELFKQLQKLDPRRAENIDHHNKRRLIRALEIALTTKKPIPFLNTAARDNAIIDDSKIFLYYALKLGIKKSPEELKKLIAARLKKRLRQGLIGEVKNLRNPPVGGGLNWKRLDDLGLEYRYVSRYLRGLITKQEMVDSILKESWQYAKRQMTWFKKDKNIRWIENEKEAYEIIKKFLLN